MVRLVIIILTKISQLERQTSHFLPLDYICAHTHIDTYIFMYVWHETSESLYENKSSMQREERKKGKNGYDCGLSSSHSYVKISL